MNQDHISMRASVSLCVLFLLSCASRTEVVTQDTDVARVMDHVGILTGPQIDSLASVSANLESKTGSQMAVLIIDSLGAETIESFSLRKANEFKLGRSEYNDGILITLAYYDRRVRIEVGTGLESILKDEIAAQLIREDLVPKFRDEKYAEGLYIAMEKISSLLQENKARIGQH